MNQRNKLYEKSPAVVWYSIPIIKDNKIYAKRILLKEFDDQLDADTFVRNTHLSYAGMVGWSYKEEFDSNRIRIV